MGPPDTGKPRQGRCPICGAPTEHRFRPFCSRRCADIDLARWLNGSYTVPVVEPDENDDLPEEGDGPVDDDGHSFGGGR